MSEKITKKTLMSAGAIAIVLMIGCYYLGYQNGKSSTPNQFAGANGGMRGGNFNRGNGMTNGSVLSKDDTSITVQGRDGSSKIVLYSPSTQIMKSTEGTIADVVAGSQVIVNGKSNADGSVTASTIQIRPNMPKPAQAGTPAQ